MGTCERLERRTVLSAGELDPTFGTAGSAVIDQLADFSLDAITVQSGSNTLAVGHSQDNTQLILKRFTFDGQLDGSFGSAGTSQFSFGGTKAFAKRLLVQSDGKIIVVGSSRNKSGQDLMALARFTSNGSLDKSFSGDGVVTFDAGGTDDQFLSTGVALSDGRILVGGSVEAAGTSDFFVARLKSDGSLDTTFRSTGKRTVDFNSRFDTLSAMTVMSDGRIVLAGNSTGFQNVLSLARLGPNGSLDQTFSGDGKATDGYLVPAGVFVQSTGRVLLAGFDPNKEQIEIRRYNADGGISTTFGTNGRAIIPQTGLVSLDDSVEESDGKLILSGSTKIDAATEGPAPFVLRVTTSGQLDSSFAEIGLINSNNEVQSTSTHLAPLSDDRVMVGLNVMKATIDAEGGQTLFRLDSDFTVTLDSQGTLNIPGTDKADTIKLQDAGAQIHVFVNGVVSAWDISRVKGIQIHAGAGADVITSVKFDASKPTIFIDGGDGNDTIFGSAAAEAIDGGAGDDVVHGAGGADTLSNEIGNDSLFGENGDDLLVPEGGNNTLFGGAGNDTIQAGFGPGADDIFGGPGVDLATYEGIDHNLFLSLDNLANDGANGEHDNLHTDIENVYGGAARDSITGDSADNFLYGSFGNDTIHGGAGNDTLKGGTHSRLFGDDGDDLLLAKNSRSDTLDGGVGNDTAKADAGLDTVNNCETIL